MIIFDVLLYFAHNLTQKFFPIKILNLSKITVRYPLKWILYGLQNMEKNVV